MTANSISRLVRGQARDLAAIEKHYGGQGAEASAITDLIGLRCGEVADAVFPSNFDRRKRDRLELALVALFEAAAAQGTPTRSAETVGLGPKDGGPVGNADAPETPQVQP